MFNSLGFIPQTPSLALIPLLTACLPQLLQGCCPCCSGGLAMGHLQPTLCQGTCLWVAHCPCCGRGAGLHLSSHEQPGGTLRSRGGGGDVASTGRLTLQKKSIKYLPQAQSNLGQSSKPPASPWPGAPELAGVLGRGVCAGAAQGAPGDIQKSRGRALCPLTHWFALQSHPPGHTRGLSTDLLLQTPPTYPPDPSGMLSQGCCRFIG